ncbi:hypothetical protein [Chryseobacterium defluvii]|uniref:Uncharacterized protein n=1 Tax=Chryseobacterium defluvii TaxID=160396 RepID=A0A495SLD9_9FLAO|nr:hypothetical protein [Chryseobacterium defluvii]RKT01091.1 hypothetical protein BCF58_0305 [Chryseobacterium defluvii]
MINFEINVSVYKTDILVIIGGSSKERKKILTKYYSKSEIENLFENTVFHEATTIQHTSGSIILLFNEKPNQNNFWLSILAHETFHVSSFIMRRVNIPLSQDSEEAYAYLQQMIFEEILDNLDNGQPAR